MQTDFIISRMEFVLVEITGEKGMQAYWAAYNFASTNSERRIQIERNRQLENSDCVLVGVHK